MKVEVVYETPQPIKEVKLTLSEQEARVILVSVGAIGITGHDNSIANIIMNIYLSLRDALKLTNDDVTEATSSATIAIKNKDFFK